MVYNSIRLMYVTGMIVCVWFGDMNSRPFVCITFPMLFEYGYHHLRLLLVVMLAALVKS